MSQRNGLGFDIGWGSCALVVCLAAGVGVSAQEDAPEFWEKTNETWFETVAEGGTVSVDNPHGNIWVRFGGYEDQVEIIATIQRLEPDLPRLTVQREPGTGRLDVRVRVERKAGDPSPEPERRDRIDLVLFVPIGRRVELSTLDDAIAVKGLKGDLQVRTVKGDVTLRKIEGAVDILSERGKTTAILGTGVTDGAQRFESVTGDIEVTLYEDAVHDLRLATSGRISTDFSLEIEYRRFEEPGKHGKAVLGGGGPELSMTSKRGAIALLRQQKFFKHDEDEKDPS